MSTGLSLLALSLEVNVMRTNSLRDGAERLEQVLRVEAERHIVADEVRVDGLGCTRLLGARGIHRHAVGREGEAQRRGAVEHERHTAHGLGELGGVDDGVVLGLLGEQAPHRREVALDQQRRHGLVAGGERDDLAIARARERDRDVAAVREGLADLGEGARRHERGGRLVGRGAAPPSHGISRSATR